jgi:hypothetical protein
MILPLVDRELRVALLRRKARWQWLKAAFISGAITALFLVVLGLTGSRSAGRTLFFWLFVLGGYGVVARGFGLTADLFSEERRNGTLGLLVLTGLGPLEIFLNKLLGALLQAGYALLGGLPFFAIPFIAGGISPTEFLCALVFLANGLLFCVALGVLSSVVHRDGGQAQASAVTAAVLVSAATPLVNWLTVAARGTALLSPAWLTLSPAYAPYLVISNFSRAPVSHFWMSSAVTLGYSLAALLLAALCLRANWRDEPQTMSARGQGVGRRGWFGPAEQGRQRRRKRWLEEQPFCWLAARDGGPVIAAQVFVAVVLAMWIGGWAVWKQRWLGPGTALASVLVLHYGLHWALAYAAGKRLAEERQTGGFEALLTTGLSVEEIVDGQRQAVLGQFRGVLLIVLGLDAGFFLSGLAGEWGSAMAFVNYALAWAGLLLVWFATHNQAVFKAMWIASWTGRPAYAAYQSVRPTFSVLVWGWFMVQGVAGPHVRAPLIPVITALAAWFAALAVFAKRGLLRKKLCAELRQIAAAPVPARGDKRFKGWNPGRIFPPGRWGDFQLRPGTSQPRLGPRRRGSAGATLRTGTARRGRVPPVIPGPPPR